MKPEPYSPFLLTIDFQVQYCSLVRVTLKQLLQMFLYLRFQNGVLIHSGGRRRPGPGSKWSGDLLYQVIIHEWLV